MTRRVKFEFDERGLVEIARLTEFNWVPVLIDNRIVWLPEIAQQRFIGEA